MLDTPHRQATCETCFFGVEQLCCLRVEGRVCPTYRQVGGETAVCLRRRAGQAKAVRMDHRADRNRWTA